MVTTGTLLAVIAPTVLKSPAVVRLALVTLPVRKFRVVPVWVPTKASPPVAPMMTLAPPFSTARKASPLRFRPSTWGPAEVMVGSNSVLLVRV